MQAVGRRLREVRIINGFSQEKVLFDTRICLTLIETEHRNVSPCTLVKLCRTYGISAHEFFKGWAMKQIRDDEALRLVAEKLKTQRKASGKLQKEVERDTGMNMGYVEAARFNLSVQTLERLCRYYGITLAEFFEAIDLQKKTAEIVVAVMFFVGCERYFHYI